MAYSCPHCNRPVSRAPSEGAFQRGGLVGVLFCAAMAEFDCPKCGRILKEEFSPEVQSQMMRGSYTLVAVAGALFAAVTAFGALWAMR